MFYPGRQGGDLNDKQRWGSFGAAISSVVRQRQGNCRVLDMCGPASPFSLVASAAGADTVLFADPMQQTLCSAVESPVRVCSEVPADQKFDIIIVDVVEPCGLFQQRALEVSA